MSDRSSDGDHGVSGDGFGLSSGRRLPWPLNIIVPWLVLTPLSIAFGAMLCAGAFAVHALNELSDAVRAGSLDSGALQAVSVGADRVDPAREGALVHVTGQAVSWQEVVDPDTGVSGQGVRLFRTVEMYQWVERLVEETRTDENDRSVRVTRYTYEPRWLQTWEDSSRFQGPRPERNPPSMPYRTEQWLAGHVTVGAFRLTPSQVERIGKREPLELSRLAPERRVAAGTLVLRDGEYYLGADPSRPKIGDMRISYSVWRPGPVSILAQQSGDSFRPHAIRLPIPAASSILAFLSPASSEIEVIRNGILPKERMLQDEQRNRRILSWVLRVAATLAMIAGVKLILWPGVALLAVMPTVRRFVGRGRGSAALRLGVGLSVISCAFVWVAARGLADETLAQQLAAAAAVALLAWVATSPLRGRRRVAMG